MPRLKEFLLLHGIVFLWGFTGIIGKLLHQESFIIVWYRVLIASLGLLVYLWITKTSFTVKRTHILPVVLIGIVVALHWITFYYAIQISTASLGILCLATTTVHVVWLEPLIMKTTFQWKKLVFSLMVVAGVAFIARDFKGDVLLATGIGLLSALLAGIFSVSNAKLSQTIPAPILSFYELTTGWVGISLYLLFTHAPKALFYLTLNDLLWLLFLGLVCTSFAFIVAINLVKKLGAYTVSLTINLEPIYTMILAVVLLSEHKILSIEFYVSAFLIVAALLLNAWLSRTPKEIIN
jgi:drug/metabolite transporter (DMT)-like permease